MLIAINAGSAPWDLNIPVGQHFSDGVVLEDLLGGNGAVVEEGHLRKGMIPPWTGAVFTRKG